MKPKTATAPVRMVGDKTLDPLTKWDVENWPTRETGEVAMLSAARVRATVERLMLAERLLSIGYPKLQLLSADDERHSEAVRAFIWGPQQ